MDACRRAANYLSVGQIYLYDNPLLAEPLRLEHVKPRLLGHWGTTPGQNFIYVHINRIIKQYSLNMIYISGPGHGGPALLDLIVAAVVGDREAETGPLATSWHGNKFLDPAHDGAVLPIRETLAAVALLRSHVPELKIRVINVVDLMRLQPATEHPHGLDDHDFDMLFTRDKPVIFGYHGYPWLIHRLTYRRTNHRNIHVRGYKEEGTISTPFNMALMNDLDRFHLVADVADRVPVMFKSAAYVKQAMRDRLIEHKQYITTYGEDMPEINDWTWSGS